VDKYLFITVKTANSDKVIFPYSFAANDPKFTGTAIFNEAQRIIQER